MKHIREITSAIKDGYKGCVVFVIQMKGVGAFEPNYVTHKQFGEVLAEAKVAGVDVVAYDCLITEESITIDQQIEVRV